MEKRIANILTGKNVAVTGATGMVGQELVRQLVDSEATIRLVVRNRAKMESLLSDWTGKRPEIVECELTNPVELKTAFEGIDIVFHCAAAVSFKLDPDDEMVRANTDITHHVVNACLDAKVGRLVHMSSIAALGEPNEQGIITTDSHPDTVSGWTGYSLSKFYSENEVWRGIQYGLEAVIVNPSIILGHGDWNGIGSSGLFGALAAGIPFYVPGVNGYVDVRDVATAMILLAVSPQAPGHRYILSGANLSYKELITLIVESVGKKPPRWNVGEKGLNAARKLENGWARLRGKEPRLTEGLVKAALGVSIYDGDAVKQVIDFDYRPIRETMKYMAEGYLKDKKEKRK